MSKIYVVRLSPDERRELNKLVKKKNGAAYKRTNAQILLKADISADGPGWKDERIAEAFDITVKTVERVRKRLCNTGLESAISRAKGGGRKRKLDGEQEAHLIALSCNETTEGRSRWTVRLLADKFVELGYVDSLSYETVRQVLKKTKLNRGKKKSGVSHL